MKVGMDKYMSKPISLKQLQDLVNSKEVDETSRILNKLATRADGRAFCLFENDVEASPLSSVNSNANATGADMVNVRQATLEKKPIIPPLPLPVPLPIKAIKMLHLQKKYMSQLEYMHREFKKLQVERQLLGAGTRNGKETTGSSERRKKLTNFILHLEETMKQIERGCKLEQEGKSISSIAFSSMVDGAATVVSNGGSETNSRIDSSNGDSIHVETCNQLSDRVSIYLTKLDKEKEEEEHVQRLEEYILTNLLPVKDRLTRRLAAQQGATPTPVLSQNSRQGSSAGADRGKGTFAAAAVEQRRFVVEEMYKKRVLAGVSGGGSTVASGSSQ